jgi:hypothetical protein
MPNLSFDYAKLTAHTRFDALTKRLGGKAQALLCLCRFWNMAQEYWGKGRRPIPHVVFDLDEEFAELLPTDFAHQEEAGVYANGAGEFFEWYAELRERGHNGGVKSVQSRIRRYGSAVPFGAKNTQNPEAATEAEPKQARSTPEAVASKPPKPSTTTSISISKSEEKTSSSLSASPTPREGRPGLNPLGLAMLWNELSGDLPKINIGLFKPNNATQSRWTQARKRLESYPDKETWEQVIKKIAASAWCNGKNDRKWKASFDYLVRVDTVAKALEGKLDDKKKSETTKFVTEADFDY